MIQVFQDYLRSSEPLPPEMMFDHIFVLEYHDEDMAIFRENFLLNYYQLPAGDRAATVRAGAFSDVSVCNSMRALLSRDEEMDRADMTASTSSGVSLLHSAAVCLGRRYGEEAIPFKRPYVYHRFYSDDWSDWVQDLAQISSSRDLHTLETLTPPDIYQIPQWKGTPLVSLIGGIMCWLYPNLRFGNWDRAIQGVMREWLRQLLAGGVNLMEYGKREHEVFHDMCSPCKGAFDADSLQASSTIVRPSLDRRTVRVPYPSPEYESDPRIDTWRPIRLVEIEYGPDPEDWRLLWAVEFEQMACEFWAWVGRCEATMPGAWVEG